MRRLWLAPLLCLSYACLVGNAAALTVGDVTPGVIFGSGNPNGGWTIDEQNNIQAALQAKQRYGSVNNTGVGTYAYGTGTSGSGSAALWNYEFAVNVNVNGTSGNRLDDFALSLLVDTDPSMGINFVDLNPLAVWTDNSLGVGTTTTANDVPSGGADLSLYWVLQNSQNLGWTLPGFNANVDGTYDFRLLVKDLSGATLAATEMTVTVGEGGAPVPEPGTMALLGTGLLGLAGAARRRMKKS